MIHCVGRPGCELRCSKSFQWQLYLAIRHEVLFECGRLCLFGFWRCFRSGDTVWPSEDNFQVAIWNGGSHATGYEASHSQQKCTPTGVQGDGKSSMKFYLKKHLSWQHDTLWKAQNSYNIYYSDSSEFRSTTFPCLNTREYNCLWPTLLLMFHRRDNDGENSMHKLYLELIEFLVFIRGNMETIT